MAKTINNGEVLVAKDYGDCDCGRVIVRGAAILVPWVGVRASGEAWQIVCRPCGRAYEFPCRKLLPQVSGPCAISVLS